MADNYGQVHEADASRIDERVQPRWVPATGIAIISLVLSAVMSAFMTAVNVGLGADFMVGVLINAALGFVVSFPTALIVVPLVVRWQMRQGRP